MIGLDQHIFKLHSLERSHFDYHIHLGEDLVTLYNLDPSTIQHSYTYHRLHILDQAFKRVDE
jgi:hypothetical protein